MATDPASDYKTFTFSTQEMEVLEPRQQILDQYRVIINDLGLTIQQFIVTTVLPRLSIDPDKHDIQFNIRKGELLVKPKPPEIIKPDSKIIVP